MRFGTSLGLPYLPEALVSTVDELEIKGYSHAERRRLIRESMAPGSTKLVAGRVILIVDDITTSGARNSDWHVGLRPGYEHQYHVPSAQARNLTRDEWYKETHDYSHYRPELPSSNMGHATELSADEYIGP
jgi:hypoxanthine phosphoribosyltransferase